MQLLSGMSLRKLIRKKVLYTFQWQQTDNGRDWAKNERFAGPFTYTGNKVAICSTAVDRDGTIFIAVSSDDNAVKIFISDDLGKSFREIVQKTSFNMTVGPRLFIKEDGSPILFVTRESGDNLSIFYSVSDSLYNWSDFFTAFPLNPALT